MTAVLFLTSLTLAATLGWMLCALMTERHVRRVEAWAHRTNTREARLKADHQAALTAANLYWLERLNERDQELRELAAFLAVVAP